MTAALQLTPGVVIGGDFEVERILELGGMGAVYTAKQRSTNKLRALKVMHPQLVADPRLRERFEQEARVGAAIASSHVVEVIAAGVDEATGAPWIAMELLEGKNLGDYAQAHGVLTPDELLEVLRQVCHALGAAHAADIVHRDIKPENIFVADAKAATKQMSVKVLDFGIAKVAAAAKTTATSTVGSPAWMAPEQTDPKARITPATDCWALGLLCFWLLTGRPFWEAAGDPDASVHALMREILFSEIPSASERAAELGVDGRLIDGFDDWFAQCVNHDLSARFRDAEELFDAFERMLHEPTPRAVVHTSVPPESRSPRSFTHGETMPMTGPIDELPASSKPFPLVEIPAKTEPMTPRKVVSSTEAAVVADAAPNAQRVPAVRRNGRRNMVIAGVGAAAITSVVFVMSSPDARPPDALRLPQPMMQSTVPTRTLASQEPVPTPSATASASATAKVRTAPAAPPPPELDPFPFALVNRQMARAASSAATLCRSHKGPKNVTVTVTWNRDGSIRSVSTGMVPGGPMGTHHCARGPFHSIRVRPYSGDVVSLSTGVNIK